MAGLAHFSLLDPAPSIALGLAAGVVLFATYRRSIGPRTAVLVAGGSLATVTAAGMASGIEHRLGSSFPHSFYLWAALPLAALGVTAAAGATRRRVRRPSWAGIAAAVLFVVFGAAQINAHYAYLPTLGDVVGAPLPDAAAGPGRHLAAAPATAGSLLAVAFPARSSAFSARVGYVWLPPSYARAPRGTLPAVMVMAGVPGEPADMVRAGGATEAADRYAAVHGGLAPILVFPDHNGSTFNDTECVDGPRGNAESYLAHDVVADVAARFGARSDHWGVIGYSEGGTCAARSRPPPSRDLLHRDRHRR